MAIFGAAEMAALSNLCHEEEDTAMQPSQTQVVQRVGPNAVGEGDEGGAPAKKKADPLAIWADDEIPPEEALAFVDAAAETRPKPKFAMLYKQLVSSEDVYLGTEKTPGSCDSNALVYKIDFPGHAQRDLDVDVTKTTLTAESKSLRLALYLPQPVLADRGTAKWDEKKKQLVVTLPVDADAW